MRRPRSTYRLQVNADFKLSRIRELVDYFAELGVSDLYLSPLLQARPGSSHGYDVTDPAQVNPEVGSAEELEALAAELRARDMGILLDIVPNHMSASEENPWWRDVLEHGRASPYAHYFDVDWSAEPPGEGRIVLPILAEELEHSIAGGDLRLVVEEHEPAIAYMDRRLPIDPATYPVLIRALLESDIAADPAVREELQRVADEAAALPQRTDRVTDRGRAAEAQRIKQELAGVLRSASSSGGSNAIEVEPNHLNELIEKQTYALTYWVTGNRLLNYRRFFDITDLAGLRTEDPDVFAAVHTRVLPWLHDGTIDGVRIDHIDGLREPTLYLEQLHAAAHTEDGGPPYVVVEKILVGPEELPSRWATAGTTGYEFGAWLNGLFVHPAGFRKTVDHFAHFTGIRDFQTVVYDCKQEAMARLFPAELAVLTRLLQRVTGLDAHSAELAIRVLTACLPVYRTYLGSIESGADDEQHIVLAFADAAWSVCPPYALQALQRVILSPQNDQEREFTLRWQQFSGPVMAKGVEDTALYRYSALVSVCDVGNDPSSAVTTVPEFHERMIARAVSWPGTLNATSTHDSKRSEDVRARINVLSEMPDAWLATVNRWFELNGRFRRSVDDIVAPRPAEELLLYQTLLGAWPLANPGEEFSQRIEEFLRKALREAKELTSWRDSDTQYEQAVLEFARSILRDATMGEELSALEKRTSFYGALNSLSQLVVKLGSPGVPDFYQGSELWSLTLVDPDNRAAVDYAERIRLAEEERATESLQAWRDGWTKLHVTRAGLGLRNKWQEVFERGRYIPVAVDGERAHNLISFERRFENRRALFIAARFYTELCEPAIWPTREKWSATTIDLEPALWQDCLVPRTIRTTGKTDVGALLDPLPFAILTAED